MPAATRRDGRRADLAVGVTECDNPAIRPVTHLFDTPSQSLDRRGWRDGDDARGAEEVVQLTEAG